jgi:hypothetical protein
MSIKFNNLKGKDEGILLNKGSIDSQRKKDTRIKYFGAKQEWLIVVSARIPHFLKKMQGARHEKQQIDPDCGNFGDRIFIVIMLG